MADLRSEERFSRNAETDVVCRLLLEKKNHGEELGSGKILLTSMEAEGVLDVFYCPLFSNDTPPTKIYILSLHDALPICASLQRTFKKSFTSFSHSTRNKTRDGLIRVRNIRALNGRF